MPTAVQPNNSTTTINHTVEVTSSIALVMGLIAIVIVAVWITNLKYLRKPSPVVVTHVRTDLDRPQKPARGYAVDSIPLVRYTPGLQGNSQEGAISENQNVSEGDVQSSIDVGTQPDQANDALACSICTEDFIENENVRILPCRHIYHPHCIDPWLLRIAGTCPLCRAGPNDRVQSRSRMLDAPTPVLVRNDITYEV